jgi:Beta-propeller repeat
MDNFSLPTSEELSDSLTSVLRSSINDNLPESLRTVIKSVTPPSDINLFVSDGSFSDIAPLFFSDNPDENLPTTIGKYIDILTTSSETNIVVSDDQAVKAYWGRHGSDSLIGFDPAVNHQDKTKIDIFTGDFTDEELFGSLSGQVDTRTRSQWSDRFILGDRQQSYYVECETSNSGLNQFAFITDFNSSQDIIQLHGSAEDYQLIDTDQGTSIFLRTKTGYDLVGLVAKTSNLNLQSQYFDFKSDTPSEPVIKEAIQIGTVGIDLAFASTVDANGNLYVGGGTGGSLAGENAGGRDAWVSKYDTDGNKLWSKQFGTTGSETIWSMASDGSNTYVIGNTAGTLGETSQGGRDIYLAKYDSDGNQTWIQQFGTSTFDESFRVTADTNGNIYISGHTVGNLAGENKNFGQNLEQFGFPSTDSYVVKFDSNGNQLWSQQFGTVELDDNWGIATDKDGNVFAGGNTRGNFGGQNAGFYDNWLVKLDKDNGETKWVKQFGTADYDFLWDLKTDSTGNLYATGYTLGDLGGKNAGSSDIWLAKFDNDGNQLWTKQFGSTGDDAPTFNSLVVDSADNIYLSGSTDSNLAGANAGSYDIWVAKYDKNGNQLWIEQFGTPDYDSPTTISIDLNGNLYLGGYTDGSLGGINTGSYDSWVVKLDANTGKIQDFTGNNSALKECSQDLVASNSENSTSGNAQDIVFGNAQTDLTITWDSYNNNDCDTIFSGDRANSITTESQYNAFTDYSSNNYSDNHFNSDVMYLGTSNTSTDTLLIGGCDDSSTSQFGANKFLNSSSNSMSFDWQNCIA